MLSLSCARRVQNMSIFTGGGPLSEPVRSVYRQLRKSLSVDPDIMATVELLANQPALGDTRSAAQRIEIQAEHVRVAFNRRQFDETFDTPGIH